MAVSAAVLSVCSEHSRRANQYHQCAAGHASLAPRATGATPDALSFVTASLRSASVLGVSVMPAFWNRSLL